MSNRKSINSSKEPNEKCKTNTDQITVSCQCVVTAMACGSVNGIWMVNDRALKRIREYFKF